MELFLNLLWFAIAVLLTGFLLRHQRTRTANLHWGTVLAATLFIGVLLFPAISASDDLYGQLFVSEDASRRALNAMSAHLDVAPVVALLSCLLLALCLGRLHCYGRVLDSASRVALSSPSLAVIGLRAPPASAL